jgi:hypothetical protein
MKIQFDPKQEYQLDAVNAVVELFDGQPLEKPDYSVIFQTMDGAIANAPIEAMRRDVFPAAEKGDTAIAKAIDHAARTAALVVVELAAGTLQVAVMVERLQPPQELLTAAGHDASDLIRAEKAMAKNCAKDFFITRREPHRRQFFGAAKARPPGEGHALILPYASCDWVRVGYGGEICTGHGHFCNCVARHASLYNAHAILVITTHQGRTKGTASYRDVYRRPRSAGCL